MDMSRYKKIFMEESREHLSKLSQLSLDLEKNPEDMEVVNAIFREAHSVKGMSASMGFESISELTHKVEDLMDVIRKGIITINPDTIDILLKSVDVLEMQLTAVDKDEDPSVHLGDIIEQLLAAAEGVPVPEKPAEERAAAGPEEEPHISTEVLRDDSRVYKVVLRVDPKGSKPHVKALLGVKKLSELGRVMGMVPNLQDLKQGNWGGIIEGVLTVNLLTGVDEADIARALGDMPDIIGHEILRTSAKPQEGAQEKKIPEHVEAVGEPPADSKKAVKPDTPEEESDSLEPSEASGEGHVSIGEMLPSGEVSSDLPRSVRIGTDVLESFINLVGELLITKSRIQVSTSGLGITPLDEAVNRLESLIRELHTKVITVRMMPLESILTRLPRLIRDIAREKKKEIDFTVTGGDIELDRAILEELSNPLMHILRNAVDHGIEPPEEREAKGKPREGRVSLNAYREKDLVFIEVVDDGRGMDPARIKESAVSRGIIGREQADLLSDEELLLLTFMPNLSTAQEVTDISGRGVGMDVVKTTVESLGGSVNLEAKKDRGTRIVMTLPLTVAIIQSLLVRVGEETYVLPLSKTVRSAEVSRDAVKRSQNQRVVIINDEMVQLMSLARLLGLPENGDGRPVIPMVVVEVRGRNIGLEVDEILGSEEVFIKSLGEPLERIPGFSGVTILGDGRPVLILDVVNLM
ncbi:MAG: chemotaxis protein CheA [Deltaproteobacteria bacterium]|nr:chemotaxis protein CheA [Candidatus Zymogenaceae bacterium]